MAVVVAQNILSTNSGRSIQIHSYYSHLLVPMHFISIHQVLSSCSS